MRRLWLLVGAALGLLGCTLSDRGGGADDADAGPVIQQRCLSGSPDGAPDLDVLFVIGNHSAMAAAQRELGGALRVFLDSLPMRGELVPNLHIGVISSDLGSGAFALSGCTSAGGDRGLLQSRPHVGGCSPPQGLFLVDSASPGGRSKNFTGDLATAFECISELGEMGCSFPQPLEAMKRALDGSTPENGGFLREHALLAVIILGNQDDCSASGPGQLFDPADTSRQGPLGPLTTFRCFEFGISCQGDRPIGRRDPGLRLGCHSDERSTLVHPVARYVDFLRTLKGNLVTVSMIGGLGNGNLSVGTDVLGNPRLEPTCTSARLGAASPALRLQQLATTLQGATTSICNNEWQLPLRNMLDVASRQTRCQ